MTKDEEFEIVLKTLEAIWAHMQEGGTHRYLIYNRLGFGNEYYMGFHPVALNISNFIFDAREAGVHKPYGGDDD